MDTHIKQVIKRSGAIVPFNQERIANAIYRAQLPSVEKINQQLKVYLKKLLNH